MLVLPLLLRGDTCCAPMMAADTIAFVAGDSSQGQAQASPELLEVLRTQAVGQGAPIPEELLQLIMQLKDEEAPFLGPRLHPSQPLSERDFLIEEDIFGFGFIKKVSLESFVLTFLQVIISQDPDDPFSFANTSYSSDSEQGSLAELNPEHISETSFIRSRFTLLRRLVLNNPYVDFVKQRTGKTDAEKWDEWQKLFIDGNTWVTESAVAQRYKPEELSYLQDSEHFSSFDDFAQALALLRNWVLTAVDEDRSWYNIFMFPMGSCFLFSELRYRMNTTTNYFSYEGVTLFTFLARCSAPDEHLRLKRVGQELYSRFFPDVNLLNELAKTVAGPSAHEVLGALACLQNSEIRRDYNGLTDETIQNSFSKKLHNDLRDEGYYVSSSVTYGWKNTDFCPIRQHRIFKQLLGDLDNILAMDLNQQELFISIGQIGLLNLMVFGLEQARGALSVGIGQQACCDINIIPVLNLSQRDSGIRKSSVERCKYNNALNQTMLRPYLKAHLKRLVEMVDPQLLQTSALNASQINELLYLISALFTFNSTGLSFLKRAVTLFQSKEGKVLDSSDIQKLLSKKSKKRKESDAQQKNDNYDDLAQLHLSYEQFTELVWDAMLIKDRNHDNYHNKFGVSIGLASSSITRGYCYYFSDDLLRTLVMAVVGRSNHMPLGRFLEQLDQRYHIIIGPNEARAYYAEGAPFANTLPLQSLDDEFTKNYRALRDQLARLGLLQSLSDYCDFVKNPFFHGLD